MTKENKTKADATNEESTVVETELVEPVVRAYKIPEGTPIIYAAMLGVMQDVGAIGKNHRNPSQNYQFRGIDDVYNALQPSLIKNGVLILPQILEHQVTELEAGSKIIHKTILKMRYQFMAVDGSSVSVDTMGEAIDYSDKATNKAMSAAFKYACFQAFCIPTKELIDTEMDNIEPGNAQRAQQANKRSNQTFDNSAPTATAPSDAQIQYISRLCSDRNLTEAAIAAEFSNGRVKEFSGLLKAEISSVINDVQKRAKA